LSIDDEIANCCIVLVLKAKLPQKMLNEINMYVTLLMSLNTCRVFSALCAPFAGSALLQDAQYKQQLVLPYLGHPLGADGIHLPHGTDMTHVRHGPSIFLHLLYIAVYLSHLSVYHNDLYPRNVLLWETHGHAAEYIFYDRSVGTTFCFASRSAVLPVLIDWEDGYIVTNRARSITLHEEWIRFFKSPGLQELIFPGEYEMHCHWQQFTLGLSPNMSLHTLLTSANGLISMLSLAVSSHDPAVQEDRSYDAATPVNFYLYLGTPLPGLEFAQLRRPSLWAYNVATSSGSTLAKLASNTPSAPSTRQMNKRPRVAASFNVHTQSTTSVAAPAVRCLQKNCPSSEASFLIDTSHCITDAPCRRVLEGRLYLSLATLPSSILQQIKFCCDLCHHKYLVLVECAAIGCKAGSRCTCADHLHSPVTVPRMVHIFAPDRSM
jgi:hypothetical protein